MRVRAACAAVVAAVALVVAISVAQATSLQQTPRVLVFDGVAPKAAYLQYKPASIIYSVDGAARLAGPTSVSSHLLWTTWNGSQGVARGADWLNDCVPSCADGHFSAYPAVIRVYRPRRVVGHLLFTRITTTYNGAHPPGQSGGSATYTLGGGNGLFFWSLVKHATPPAKSRRSPLPIRALHLTLPPLSVGSSGRIVDAEGRQVMLRGVNVTSLVNYWQNPNSRFAPAAPLLAGDPTKMASIGWDAVRLAISWSRVEPRRGHYDRAYLAQVAATVRRLAHAGLYTVIDMHQDAWSATLAARPGERCLGAQPAKSYDGAPGWATLVPTQAPRCFVFARELDPAVMAAWQAFFRNVHGIQTQYVHMWGYVARYFAREPGVAGFDLMNEPNSFGQDLDLSGMYGSALRAIRAGERAGNGPAHLVLFEPSVTFSSPLFGPGGGPFGWFGKFSGPPPDFARDRNTVYAPHLYQGAFSPYGPITKQEFAEVASQARALRNAPVVVGEWGTSPARAADGDPYFLDHQALQDQYLFGAFLWEWRQACGSPEANTADLWGEFNVDCTTKGGQATRLGYKSQGERTTLVSQLTRGYVRAAAGQLDKMSWSPTSRALTASGTGTAGAGPMIAFLPPGPTPRMRSKGLRDRYLAHAPGGGWYLVATARGGTWSFTATA